MLESFAVGVPPEEVKKKIFDPFFTTKQPGKGTGLGLASAYGIVGSHKGFISVDTELGQGTSFHAFFPAITDEGLVEPEKKTAIERGQGRILLVDDEEDVRVSVITCENGEAAVQWYREHDGGADLVLLDVMMPIMTGDQCAEELRRIDPLARILFMSGYSRTLSPEKLKALSNARGPVRMVRKPFTLEHLSRMVKEALSA